MRFINFSKKILSYCLALALTLAALPLGLINFSSSTVASATQQEVAGGYYYDQLSADAKKFYWALGNMNANGYFLAGNQDYDLVEAGVLNQTQLATYDTSNDILIAFGSARDAYRLEHPELFYVDFSLISVSVYKNTSGTYSATLGTGRAESYFADGFTAENIEEKIATFNSNLTDITNQITGDTNAEKVKSASNLLVEQITYTYDGENVHNAYGAIVNKTAVCEGYSHAFKIIMDKLGINCVLVSGYASADANSGWQAHMWNYVQLDGQWYAVDVTWNDATTTDGKQNIDTTAYLLRGNTAISLDHQTDGVVSSANFEFRYPALSAYDYGVTEVDGLLIEYVENTSGDSNLLLKIRFQGKTAKELQADGLYLAVRFVYDTDMQWSNWYDLISMYGENDYNGYSASIGPSALYVQFAVINYSAETELGDWKYYNPDTLKNTNFIMTSEPYGNANYGTHVAPPYMISRTPGADEQLNVFTTYTIEIEYDEALKLLDSTKEAGVVVVSKHADIAEYAKITNIVWDVENPTKIKFDFTPSQMYQHRFETYTFYLVNLVGKDSGVCPAGTSFLTEQTAVVCDKVFGDGRLYMKIYGEPSLIASSDLSIDGWEYTDENGETQKASQNQRSQLVLVASKPSTTTSDKMVNGAVESENTTSASVLASETFELELDICSRIASIPEGSYMQLAFGFPSGYGPEDEGVTFKVYHFKKLDSGEIDYDHPEELDCVITQYGLVVTVNSFSPFAVVAYSSDAVSYSAKTIFASTTSVGGIFTSSYLAGNIAKLENNGSVTYTITPNDGYQIDRILLNGKAVDASLITNGEGNAKVLTLGYNDLDQDSNTLEISFVASTVLTKEADSGLTVVRPASIVLDPMGTMSVVLSSAKAYAFKGDTATIKANVELENATVLGKITYTWYKDGELIENPTTSEDGSELIIEKFSSEDAGKYSAVVSYTYGGRTQIVTAEAISIRATNPSGFNIYVFTATILLIIVFAVSLIVMWQIKKRVPKAYNTNV